MFTDLPLAQLREYRSDVTRPADFQSFWGETLGSSQERPLNATFRRYEAGFPWIEVYDVCFAGYGGNEVKGWLMVPALSSQPRPGIVQFAGYGGGRGNPLDHSFWASAGFVHLVMDTRGQGSVWGGGSTADTSGSGPSVPGFLTKGIDSPETYYYRRVYVDAVRAVAALRASPAVDPSRVAVLGGSQGGGIALAVAGLDPTISHAIIQTPFLADMRRASTLVDTDPYGELVRYLSTHRTRVEKVFETLSYFDGVNFARQASAYALFSVGLMDDVCPPSTAFAAYNEYAGPKDISVWPYNGHEGGGSDDIAVAFNALRTPTRGTESPVLSPHNNTGSPSRQTSRSVDP
jgi:cephalosporin-C deacetylase